MAAYSFLEALLRLPGVYQPRVSPDGKWVAWSWFHKDDRANIYLVPADGSARSARLTDSAEDMFPVSWDADCKSLLVECCEDGNERMRLYECILFVAESGFGSYCRVGLFNRTTNRICWLINDPQRNIEHSWVPSGSDYVAVFEVKNAHEHYFLLDINTLREVHLLPSQDGGTLIPLAPAVHDICTGGRTAVRACEASRNAFRGCKPAFFRQAF